MTKPGCNAAAPVLHLAHGAQQPVFPGQWSVACPVCDEGRLSVHRSSRNLKLLAPDVCLLCGQRVAWTDIAVMRERDWA